MSISYKMLVLKRDKAVKLAHIWSQDVLMHLYLYASQILEKAK